jgi:hypothetical protein
MVHCAALFAARIMEVENGLEWLSSEEYAEDVGNDPTKRAPAHPLTSTV